MYEFDPRWPEDPREHDHGSELSQGSRGGSSDSRDRAVIDPRDVFTKDLNLPRGPERQRVRARDYEVRLRGSESRTVATVGAFHVVPAGDLRDADGKALDPGRGDLRHLKSEGLVQTIPAVGEDRALVVLTEKGRDVLETNRLSTVLQRELGSAASFRDIVDDRWSRDNRTSPTSARSGKNSTRAFGSLVS